MRFCGIRSSAEENSFVLSLLPLDAIEAWLGGYQSNPSASPAEAWALASSYLNLRGHLVTITSAEENAFIYSTFSAGLPNQGAWIGAFEPSDDGIWVWADGPEAGVQFSYSATPTAPSFYANWGGNRAK